MIGKPYGIECILLPTHLCPCLLLTGEQVQHIPGLAVEAVLDVLHLPRVLDLDVTHPPPISSSACKGTERACPVTTPPEPRMYPLVLIPCLVLQSLKF